MLRDTRSRNVARRFASATAIAGVLAVLAGAPATADANDTDGFEAFSLGEPLGQFGWATQDIGGYNAANFDNGIVDPSAVWGTTLGNRALRMSNSVYSLAFGNQLQSFSLADEAAETDAADSPYSGGTRQSRLTGSITFASATQTYQPGLAITISPDEGSGTRMSFFRITDQPTGLKIEVSLLDNSIPGFVTEVIAEDLDRTQVHTFDFIIDFVDGDENDVLWTRVGGACNTWNQSGTWETYHRLYGGGGLTHPTDSLLFRISGDPGANAASLLGNGLLFDNIALESSTVPPMPPIGVPGAPTEPLVFVNDNTVNVTGSPVTTNSCVPVTQYILTLTPLSGGDPITFTSPTPNFSFPAPGTGLWTVVIEAENGEGVGAPSPEATITVLLAAEDGGGTLADSGPRDDAPVTGAAAAALTVAGIGLIGLAALRRRRAY
jgi:hypothetical protein